LQSAAIVALRKARAWKDTMPHCTQPHKHEDTRYHRHKQPRLRRPPARAGKRHGFVYHTAYVYALSARTGPSAASHEPVTISYGPWNVSTVRAAPEACRLLAPTAQRDARQSEAGGRSSLILKGYAKSAVLRATKHDYCNRQCTRYIIALMARNAGENHFSLEFELANQRHRLLPARNRVMASDSKVIDIFTVCSTTFISSQGR
jgi:hypothetical protein